MADKSREIASLREAYGKALVRIGRGNPDIVALDADLGKSTFSRSMLELGPHRYIEVGIAEQNMAALSAGLAVAGKIPFFSSFAVFATGRAYDQIRSSVSIPGFNVNLCGSSAGLSDYGDGKTHQSIDDIALMRVLPGMVVLAPVDAHQVDGMVEAMAGHDGPCYIRIPRNDLPIVTEPGAYRIGQVDILSQGTDVAILACGGSVHSALEASEMLARDPGLSTSVVNVGTIKPFPTNEIRSIVATVRAVVVVEEHSVIGGLGCAVREALSGMAVPVGHLGIDDAFGRSAETYESLLEHYGLTARDITREAGRLIQKQGESS